MGDTWFLFFKWAYAILGGGMYEYIVLNWYSKTVPLIYLTNPFLLDIWVVSHPLEVLGGHCLFSSVLVPTSTKN